MPTIERYTKGIIRDRQVADLTNPQAIATAGSGFRAAADVSAAGADITRKMVEAHEATAVNEAIIKNKKQKMEFLEAKRQENISNPVDFHKRIEPELQKIDAEMEMALPTSRAKAAFKERMSQINLAAYEDNMQWSSKRQVEMYAQSVDTAAQELGVMAYRRGESGASIDDLIKDAQATAVAGSTIVAPEKVADINRKTRQTVIENYINATAERNPHEAKKLLASGKYDDVIDAGYLRGQNIYIDNKIKQAQAEQERARLTQKLLDVANASVIADPGNKDHREAINQSFVQSGMADAFNKNDPAAQQGLLDIFQRTSIIPEAAQSTLRGYIMNGSAEQKAAAYTFVGKMQEINPVAITGSGGFSEKEIKEAAIYNQFIRSGADTNFALAAVQDRNNPLSSDVREMRQKELAAMNAGDNDKQKTLRDMARQRVNDMQGQSASWWNLTGSGVPDFMEGVATSSIMAKYERIFDEEFLRTGSQEAASAAAAAVIDRYAGTTQIRGKAEIMEFPPEKYYAAPGLTPEENSKWMRQELEQSIKQVRPDVSIDDVFLVPAPESRHLVDNGKKPMYYAWHKINDYGGMDTLRGEDNLPVLVDFDPSIGAREAEKARAVKKLEALPPENKYGLPYPFSDWLDNETIKDEVAKARAESADEIVKEVLGGR